MIRNIADTTLLVCGNSLIDYPREETIMLAINELPFKKVYDLRFINQFWLIYSEGAGIIDRVKQKIQKYFGDERKIKKKIFEIIKSKQIDIILVMRWNEQLVLELLDLGGMYNIPVVYDLFSSRLLAAKRNEKDVDYWSKIEAEILSRCDVILAMTEPYKQFFVDTYGCEPQKIAIVPLAVDDTWMKMASAGPRKANDIFKVGYWGGALKHHGLDVAFKSARLLTDYPAIEFNFMGSSRMRQHQELIESSPNMKYIGWVQGRDELIKKIDEMDVCFGHLAETHDAHLVLPNKAMEAMARGKVVIHVASTQMKKLYGKEDRECVVFFDNGASGLADVILDLYKNAAKIDRICLAAKQKVLVDHSVTAVKEALQTVF
jgi:glycosyltransferase involved in cell wall biosynthesis